MERRFARGTSLRMSVDRKEDLNDAASTMHTAHSLALESNGRSAASVPAMDAQDGPASLVQRQAAADDGPPVQLANNEGDIDGDADAGSSSLDKMALFLLCVQHFSNSWVSRSSEFAFPLFFIRLYTNTLLPASLYGFLTTAVAIVFSGSMGSIVDRLRATKLRCVRGFIVSQKLSAMTSYALFCLLFYVNDLQRDAQNDGRGRDGGARNANVWSLLAAIVIAGCPLM